MGRGHTVATERAATCFPSTPRTRVYSRTTTASIQHRRHKELYRMLLPCRRSRRDGGAPLTSCAQIALNTSSGGRSISQPQLCLPTYPIGSELHPEAERPSTTWSQPVRHQSEEAQSRRRSETLVGSSVSTTSNTSSGIRHWPRLSAAVVAKSTSALRWCRSSIWCPARCESCLDLPRSPSFGQCHADVRNAKHAEQNHAAWAMNEHGGAATRQHSNATWARGHTRPAEDEEGEVTTGADIVGASRGRVAFVQEHPGEVFNVDKATRVTEVVHRLRNLGFACPHQHKAARAEAAERHRAQTGAAWRLSYLSRRHVRSCVIQRASLLVGVVATGSCPLPPALLLGSRVGSARCCKLLLFCKRFPGTAAALASLPGWSRWLPGLWCLPRHICTGPPMANHDHLQPLHMLLDCRH